MPACGPGVVRIEHGLGEGMPKSFRRPGRLGFKPDPVGVRTDPYPSDLALDVLQRFNRTKLMMAGVVLPFE